MEELTTIIQLLLLSLWCHGWHYLFSPGEALHLLSGWAYKHFDQSKLQKEREQAKVNDWYRGQLEITPDEQRNALIDLYNEKLEETTIRFERQIYILKSLFLCPICFASIYGIGGYLLLNYTEWGIFPVAIIALISVNKLLNKLL